MSTGELEMRKKISVILILLIFVFTVLAPVSAGKYEIKIRVALLMNQQAVRLSCSQGLTAKNAHTLENIVKNQNQVTIKTYKQKIYVNKTPVGGTHVYVVTDDYRTPVYLNGVPYRGYFLIGFNDKKNLMVINHVSLEYYLGGVLGGEIIPSWPLEAIKAQAVAARSYVLYKTRKNSKKLYDVVNNTADQMYLGVRGESPRFNQALRETRGEVLSRGKSIVCAYYHSNSGGHTSDSWNAFKKDYGKLAGVKDPYCAGAPNSSWRVSLTESQVRKKLNQNGFNFKKIFSIKPYSTDRSGRVVYLEISHPGGKDYIFGADFRKFMGYRVIKSTRFSIYPKSYTTYRYNRKITANRGSFSAVSTSASGISKNLAARVTEFKKVPTRYVFKGSGWGHGVGMSQWGARGMARSGYNYRQILKHYYPGTTISIVRAK